MQRSNIVSESLKASIVALLSMIFLAGPVQAMNEKWVILEISFYQTNDDASILQMPQTTFSTEAACQTLLSSRIESGETLIKNRTGELVISGGSYNKYIRKCVVIFG